MQKTREEKVLSLRAKTGWCITMQNLVLKTRAFQNSMHGNVVWNQMRLKF